MALDFVRTERRAVDAEGACLVRRAEPDDGPGQRSATAARSRPRASSMACANLRRCPCRRSRSTCQPMASKRAGDILRKETLAGAGQGDVVLVVEIDQLAEPEVPGERGRLHGDAFHDVAVGDDAVGVVVDDLVTVGRL